MNADTMKTFQIGTALIIFLIVLIVGIKYKTANSSLRSLIPSATVIPHIPITVTQAQNKKFNSPLDKPAERISKKKFGTYVTPQNSPVQPERFTGYHVGVDFETFPQEKDADIQVHAICDGTLSLKEYASGYGGVTIESCQLDGKPITIIYGHVRLSSITLNSGGSIKAGDIIGVLGTGYSSETDGERKHLHLGIHKGSEISILGYVQTKADLSDFIDPCLYICH